VDVQTERAACNVPDHATTNSLNQYQDIYRHTDAVMGIGEVARRPDGDKSEDEDYGGETNGEDLEIGMVSDGRSGVTTIEANEERRYGQDEEKSNGGEHSMPENEAVILCERCEAVGHACKHRC